MANVRPVSTWWGDGIFGRPWRGEGYCMQAKNKRIYVIIYLACAVCWARKRVAFRCRPYWNAVDWPRKRILPLTLIRPGGIEADEFYIRARIIILFILLYGKHTTPNAARALVINLNILLRLLGQISLSEVRVIVQLVVAGYIPQNVVYRCTQHHGVMAESRRRVHAPNLN